jgi:hypothetical protein
LSQIEAARRSLGTPLVVDISTLVIGGHLRQLWPRLRASFSPLELPRPALHDILNAVERLRAPSQGSLYFDVAAQGIQARDADPAVQAQLLDHAEWVATQATDVVVVDWPQLVAVSDTLDDTFLPWLSSLDMAKTRGLPLFATTLAAERSQPAMACPRSARPH